ncbi:DUF1214 domain-containing protein [Vibrio superstes]|uniref:Murein transglycosylase n=1 Tax=Vibrio superstes NBRC 103154 TaxID=1219062 RepID=A0A511QP70_9VIBR|nr:DUF1214 domain-containing protein [Vibrio superstes]GEM79114.1 murein transglycosylase [Vibrio superstes NBRC 103154]
MKKLLLTMSVLSVLSHGAYAAVGIDGKDYAETIPVTADNITQVEAEVNFLKWKNKDAMNKMFDLTIPTPAGPMPTVRMNRDTLYSAQVADASNGLTITMPEDNEVFTSVLVINENGYSEDYIWQKGTHKILPPEKGKFVWVLFRIGLENGIDEARKVQKTMKVEGQGNGVWEPKPYDKAQYETLHKEYMQKAIDGGIVLDYGHTEGRIAKETKRMSDAVGWGGMDFRINSYQVSKDYENSGCYQTTFEDPRVDEFWSITVYSEDGWLLPTDMKTVLNSRDAKPNQDGSYTVSFNCGEDAINNLETGTDKTFNWAWRAYGSSYKVKAGKWNPISTFHKVK